MKTSYSKSWKSSIQPRKQRKYAYNAPLHVQKKMLGTHLSKELREKYSRRTMKVRSGDKVKVMRGQHKNKTGKVDRVNTAEAKIFITGIDITKKDGSKSLYPFKPSNLLITDLNVEGRKLKAEKTEAKPLQAEKVPETKQEAKNE